MSTICPALPVFIKLITHNALYVPDESVIRAYYEVCKHNQHTDIPYTAFNEMMIKRFNDQGLIGSKSPAILLKK